MRLNFQVETWIVDEQLGEFLKGVFILFSDVGFVEIPVDFGKYEVIRPRY